MTEYIPLDEDNLAYAVGLARELHGLGTFGRDGPPFDWDWCRCKMAAAMHNADYYFTLARDETGYVGAVCGAVTTFYFSPQLMGVEEAWYVREGTSRRAAVAMRLMRGFTDWCLYAKGALLVQSGDVANINSIGVDALYRRLGFVRFGAIYKYARR